MSLALQGGGAHSAFTWGVLDRLWISTGERAVFSPFQRTLADRLLGRWNLDHAPGYLWFNLLGRLFSPYQTNPLNHHPPRDILAGQIDVEAVRACPG